MKSKLLLLCFLVCASAKIFKRCELAKDLKYKYGFDPKEIPVWVCIAKHESNFNTSAVNSVSGDHGLFQISDLYWCGIQQKAGACYANCDSFKNDDIADDLQCIRRIFNEHQRLSGNGFNAWVVYPLYCRGKSDQYVEGCFQNDGLSTTTEPSTSTSDNDDEYEFPPLPVFPKRNTEALPPLLLFDVEDLIFL
ncbi:lysozyme C-like [Coccinella septempunctata]|uniref:lysozyme C-like n=1 Tax=Coccinella septempunctata TaxID=41139 RepID=UPI001D064B61|nr:lysozyme C-like [Coccinella septempunctata]